MAEQGFRNVPVYRGGVKACIFDFAGTVCDAGVFAPVLTFQQLFVEEGVPITAEEVRAPMGVHKRIHIQRICQLPEVNKRWIAAKGKAPTNDDAERIYIKSLTATLDLLPTNSKMITGVAATIARLRSEFGVKIGGSTGYTQEIMAKLRPLLAASGYSPDSIVTSDEVPSARPGPNMILLNMIRLDLNCPAAAVVKCDDSAPGIIAGLHAGTWTVGIAKTGNYVGMSEAEMAAADPKVLAAKVKAAADILYQAGAHFVIDTTVDLPPVIAEINKRMALGLRP